MSKLSRALPLLGLALTFFVGGALFLPQHVRAAGACEKGNVNPDCLSFNVTTNPLLVGYTANGASYVGAANVGGGKCQDYVKGILGATRITGCLSVDGKNFTVYDSNNVVTSLYDQVPLPTGAIVTTSVDSQGRTAGSVSNPTGEAVASTAAATGCRLDTLNLGVCLVNVLGDIIATISFIVLMAASVILGLANYLLNWSAYITVFQFGKLVGNSEGLLAAWGVMRDVGNIVLLFGFIFLGVSTILNLPHSEYTAKRALPALLIFALLLNFSLLAAEAIIDTSNALATSIYTQAGGGVCETSDNFFECSIQQGIGGKVMDATGIGSVFAFRPQDHAFGDGQGSTEAVIIIGLTLFTIITALVLFAAAIMLIIRAVVLALLMVTAPIGFAGMAIPPLQEMAGKWWSQLLSQAFFAPIYFLLVLVSLKVMEGVMGALGTTGQSNSQTLAQIFTTSATGGGSTNTTIGITFALIIGFMIAAIIFAKNSSAIGTGYAIKSAGALSFGTLGFLGRRTVGTGANAVASRIRGSTFAQNRPGLARLAETPFKYLSESSLSMRGVASGLGKGAHLDFGKPNKTAAHGFHGIEEKEKKAIEDFEKRVRPTAAQKGVATETEKELEKKKKDFKRYRAKELQEVHDQRLKVEQARLKNDKETLEVEREKLAEKIKNYNDKAKDVDGKALNDQIKTLEARLKTWNNYAETQKREGFLEGLHGQAYIPVLGAPEEHASHEAARNIRKNGGKSEIDRALDTIKKGAKEEKPAEEEEEEHGPEH